MSQTVQGLKLYQGWPFVEASEPLSTGIKDIPVKVKELF